MKKFIKSQRIQHGSVSLILTVLVVVAVIIVNMIAAALAGRYEWMYVDMNANLIYAISDDCKDYLSTIVIPEVDKVREDIPKQHIEIIFCDDKENILEDQSRKYIHDSVYEIGELFPGYIEVDYLNIWENPSLARSYGVSATTDVVCKFGDRFETMDIGDFYVFEAGDSSTPVAYNGEKIIASCLMRVTQENTPVCYFTANHGESFGDYEFMRILVEAGYMVAFIDLSSKEIPEDCELLITFDPKQDLIIADSVSSVSEVDKINEYMNAGGKYMVFLSADTFVSGSRANLEGLLGEWGVKYMHEAGDDGIENCYVIKDRTNSLTIDGYTVLSETAKKGIGARMMDGLSGTNVFGNTTCIAFADGYVSDGNGNFIREINGISRTAAPLMLSHESAEAWTAGRAVARASGDPFVFMTMTTQTCANGKQAYLIACASTAFASEDAMQSSVLGNSRTLTGIVSRIGKNNAPVDLVFKPFVSTEIESLTTSTANTVTAVFATVPTLVCLIIGAVVLIRRKNK